MPRRLLVCCLLASLLIPLPAAAEQEESASMQVITIGKLRQEISSHREKLEQSEEEERSLLGELAAMENKIGQQRAKIEALQTRLREQEQVIEAKERELVVVTEKTEDLRRHLIKRLRSFYLLGKTGLLNTVFSTNNLPDLMVAADSFQSLVTYDQELFTEYRTSVAAIDRAKQARELERTVQEHFLTDADAESRLLQQAADEKNKVLKRIQTEKGLYAQALKEMRRSESELMIALTKDDSKPERKPVGFLAQKKKLPPPVWGKIIRRFNEPGANEEETTFANGITILPPDRAEVFAVYGGLVIFAGHMSGYGKMVIIEHDQQYYTISARLDEIEVLEGDPVRQGQIIGIAGTDNTLFGQGFYFEVRRDAQPENPLNWIRPNTLAER